MYVGICSTIPLIYFVSQFGTIRFTLSAPFRFIFLLFVSGVPVNHPDFVVLNDTIRKNGSGPI